MSDANGIPVTQHACLSGLGAKPGAAIRRVLNRVPRTAASLQGSLVAVIEARLKEHEDDMLRQSHTLDEQLNPWQRAD